VTILILDRDGVINFDSKHYIKSPEEWQPIPGSLEAIAALSNAGYTIAVATNQSGVGRKLYDQKTLAAIHEKMQAAVTALGGKIAAIFYCPHIPDEFCFCRKPEPGLLHQIRDYFQCDLNGVWLVGDSLRDLQAAEKVGCQPVLVKTGNGSALFNTHTLPAHYRVFDDLSAVAAELIASQR
jgi:D-glycero-D-manno-heptose 1,7-bisphosphate phosphatase